MFGMQAVPRLRLDFEESYYQMKSAWNIIILLFMITIFAGCGEKPEVDQSLITQSPCGPPCWYGLEIDKSTHQEVIDKLKTLKFVVPTTIIDHDDSYNNGENSWQVTYQCHKNNRDYWCGSLQILNGKLVRISSGPPYKMTIKEIIDIYGVPDYVRYRTPISPGGGCGLSFIWVEKKMMIGYYDHFDSKPCVYFEDSGRVNPVQRINEVHFLDNDLLLQIVNKNDTDRGAVIDWPGFTKK
jgi:hypothetical protein